MLKILSEEELSVIDLIVKEVFKDVETVGYEEEYDWKAGDTITESRHERLRIRSINKKLVWYWVDHSWRDAELAYCYSRL